MIYSGTPMTQETSKWKRMEFQHLPSVSKCEPFLSGQVRCRIRGHIKKKSSKAAHENVAHFNSKIGTLTHSFVGKIKTVGKCVNVGVQFFAGFHHNHPETMGRMGMTFPSAVSIVTLDFSCSELAT